MGHILRTTMSLFAVGLIVGQAPALDPAPLADQPLPPGSNLIDPLPLGPPPADEPTPRILNDTAQYCEALRIDIANIRAQRGEIPAHAAMLTREGERMCRIGHIKPGIYRLRSALMILRQKANGSE